MYRLTYRGQNIEQYNSIALCRWKINNLCFSRPDNWKKEHFKIINL